MFQQEFLFSQNILILTFTKHKVKDFFRNNLGYNLKIIDKLKTIISI